MDRIIYSIYIDINETDWDLVNAQYDGESISKSEKSTWMFKKYYHQLNDNKQKYADSLGIKYILFECDSDFENFYRYCKSISNSISKYEIINFYKFNRLEKLAKTYDEILFLDFDVIVKNQENFFDCHDLNQINISPCSEYERNFTLSDVEYMRFDRRAPLAKRYNASFFVNMSYIDIIPYNTAVMGMNSDIANLLNYFDNFQTTLELMDDLLIEDNHANSNYVELCGHDNETIFSIQTIKHNVPIFHIDASKWHHRVNNLYDQSIDFCFGHYITKDFNLFFD